MAEPTQEELLERVRDAFGSLAADCRNGDGGTAMDAANLLKEARQVVGNIDDGPLVKVLAGAAFITHRNAIESGLEPVALALVTGMRLGEKFGYAKCMEGR